MERPGYQATEESNHEYVAQVCSGARIRISAERTTVVIPKILHVYFGGPMHYLHYLSIWSFAKFNDGWRIYVHRPVTRSLNFDKADGGMYPELNVGNYWDRLASEVDCVINWVDFDRIGFYNGAGEVHKSDYLRLWLLS